jgi:hypothetical protein
LNFGKEFRVALSFEVDRPVQVAQEVVVFTGRQDHRAQRRSAHVRASADQLAAVFVIGVKGKLHRHPFLNAENLRNLRRARQLDLGQNHKIGLNCYPD